jgi:hypothetical protein
MIIQVPRSPLEQIYHMYGCRNAYNIRMKRYYLIGLK